MAQLAQQLTDAAGMGGGDGGILSSLATVNKAASRKMREAWINGVLNPVIPHRVQVLMEGLAHADFTPQFSATEREDAHFEDVRVSSIPVSDPRIPRRMFDVDTGSMAGDFTRGQYIILSHSWKGNEVTFPVLQKVIAGQRKNEQYETILNDPDVDNDTKIVAKFQRAKYAHLKPGMNHLQLIRAECMKDLDDQTGRLKRILGTDDKSTIRGLVSKLANYKHAGSNRWDAKGVLDEQVRKRDAAQRGIDVDASKIARETNSVVDSERLQPNDEEKAAARTLDDASKKLSEAEAEWNAAASTDDLRAAMNDLLSVLEKIKSLQKIEASMEEAKRVFDTGMFGPKGGKRLLWNDTICINKTDANELNDSLSMMGEWYANSELCLVHIDTPTMDWLEAYDNVQRAEVVVNYDKFDQMAGTIPKWATRGWTLQELVLPKLCMFLNSMWSPLTRPVEFLGPYYYLMGFLAQHVKADATRYPDTWAALTNLDMLRGNMEEIQFTNFSGSSDNDEFVEKTRRLIGLLEFLGVKFPMNADEDTANSRIQFAIQEASDEAFQLLTQSSGSDETTRLTSLLKSFKLDLASPRSQISAFIKLIVAALVIESEHVIADDKLQLYKFTNVPPQECCRGWRRAHHPAEKILELAAYRECTVATDRVYSLMGVLDVQFTAFHAEGLTKGLSRLLDEVVITKNDVSVFNWAGKNLASPQRGRSLYPLNLTAYDPGRDEKVAVSRRRLKLGQDFKQKKYKMRVTSDNLEIILKGFVAFVKSQENDLLPVPLLKALVNIIKATPIDGFEELHLKLLASMLTYFQESEHTTTSAVLKSEEASAPEPVIEPPAPVKEEPPAPKPAKAAPSGGKGLGRFGKMPSMPTALPSVSVPSFGMGKSDGKPAESKAHHEAAPKHTVKPTVAQPAGMNVVHKWLESATSFEMTPLLSDVQAELGDVTKQSLTQPAGQESETPIGSGLSAAASVSPNPITVGTSGITGFFDIQRVIVEMDNPALLWEKVNTAAHPSQKVEGHIKISTAIAALELDFCCTAGQLKKQLNIADLVKISLDRQKELPKQLIDKAKHLMGKRDDKVMSQDEMLATRMLDFVEESKLDMIAGEWVLARFSGAPAAKWFLCAFELGSSDTYFGYRIATDEIDFTSVEPEVRLIRPWERFMEDKKLEMCRIVELLLQGKDQQKSIQNMGKQRKKEDDPEKEDDTDEEDDNLSMADSILERGTTLFAKATESAYGLLESQLSAAMADTVLRKVPKNLRAAIMNLNENEYLLPAMFTSDVKIHMF